MRLANLARRRPGLPPSRQVGDQHVGIKVELRLIEDPPSPGPPDAALVFRSNLDAEGAGRKGMGLGRARLEVEPVLEIEAGFNRPKSGKRLQTQLARISI